MRICPCCTDIPAMLHQSVTEIIPLFRWNDLPQFHLYFFRFLDVFYQSHAVHQTDTVCVCDDRRFSKHIPHDQIRTFASDPRKFQQCIKIIRHFSTVLLF